MYTEHMLKQRQHEMRIRHATDFKNLQEPIHPELQLKLNRYREAHPTITQVRMANVFSIPVARLREFFAGRWKCPKK